MASADLRKELECSVCLNIYTDPVTLKCGHNFCRDCIGRVWGTQEGSGGYSCPECREEFQDRPLLHRNITLRNIVENFLSTHPDQEESGVFCTYCIHTPVPAVISCLHCEASLCDNHLRVHSKSPEHVLCDPTTSLENRKCSVHKKILEYYCTEDETCICMSCCLIGDHINHKKESLDEASEMKKKKLRNVLQKLMTEREEMEKRVQSLQEHGRKVQGEADDETERVTVLFRDLRRRLEDLEKRVLREISGQAERISGIINDLVQDLEIKKEELSRKLRHIEELCNVTDPLTVLQESDTGDLCDTEDGDDEDRERHDKLLHDGGDLDVGGISHTLHTGLSDIMSGVNVEKCPGTHVYPHSTTKGDGHINAEPSRKRLKPSPIIQPSRGPPQPSPTIQPSRGPPQPSPTIQPSRGPPQPSPTIQPSRGPLQPSLTIQPSRGPPQPSPTIQHSHLQAGGPNIGAVQQTLGVSGVTDILLDVRTAGNNLHISDDGKTATWSSSPQNRPETPERFEDYQVMSSQRFSSGRHYWEVDVEGAGYWIVGMCYPSIDRRGRQSRIGDNKKSWGLEVGRRLEGVWGLINQLSVIHDSNETRIRGGVSSRRVGIDLDYEAGRISFYDLCDSIRHLHTFTTTFTEPLHAGVWVGVGCIKICGGNQK
ncbi:E3 ubiquitin/ISG15 ligase TRIM25-like [Lithobates pipiens]